eukprot:1452748-Lingulodinium_polyedra.AAC.1
MLDSPQRGARITRGQWMAPPRNATYTSAETNTELAGGATLRDAELGEPVLATVGGSWFRRTNAGTPCGIVRRNGFWPKLLTNIHAWTKFLGS